MAHNMNYDVVFRFTNDTPYTSTFEVWGPNNHGRDNGVVILLRPGDTVAFMVNASLHYFYCIRHHGIEAGFSVKIPVDTGSSISEIIPAHYQQLPVPYNPRPGVTVRRYRPLSNYTSH
ncbi:hypothetical protein BV25DRAFT_1819151 [Artomyces pyxidatus]|uniref:Uncharacterized protein n=1 Tax=Artomyces pyxidatus TaxID=48021 RepID=A0ACB8TH23_9AGAM|nr:hypothetical protein BV25DRAFT_1819151 [Artomyces pyxidatus]